MFNLVFSGFVGLVVYLYVVDSLAMPHTSGVTCALLASFVVCAFLFAWEINAEQLSTSDKRSADRWRQ